MSIDINVCLRVTVGKLSKREGIYCGIYEITGVGQTDIIESFTGDNEEAVRGKTLEEFERTLREFGITLELEKVAYRE